MGNKKEWFSILAYSVLSAACFAVAIDAIQDGKSDLFGYLEKSYWGDDEMSARIRSAGFTFLATLFASRVASKFGREL
jgi:hypothetical protein